MPGFRPIVDQNNAPTPIFDENNAPTAALLRKNAVCMEDVTEKLKEVAKGAQVIENQRSKIGCSWK